MDPQKDVAVKRVFRVLVALALTLASVMADSYGVRADSACTSLPIDSTYTGGAWTTGGTQHHGTSPLRGVQGNIRTYNPFAAYTAGGVQARIILYNGSQAAIQGWTKQPSGSGDPYNAVIWNQITDANGVLQLPYYYQVIQPPTVYTYRILTDGAGTWTFALNGNGYYFVQTGPSGNFTWLPEAHEVDVQVHNWTGDQLAGDNGTHMTFRNMGFYDGTTWLGGAFGNPGNPWFVGHPYPSTWPNRAYDYLSYTTGSDFDTWDSRCG